MFFVLLQSAMKKILTDVTALLLVLWYSLSVIGFDVHTCSDSGDAYIATVASGFTCEDIHPGHGHSGCSCCHHHEADDDTHELGAGSCCSDEFHVIIITGVKNGNHDDACGISCPIQDMYFADAQGLQKITSFDSVFHKARSGSVPPADLQVKYGIWRI